MAKERGGADKMVPTKTTSANSWAPIWTNHPATAAIKVTFGMFSSLMALTSS
jgi:hypothetical protein